MLAIHPRGPGSTNDLAGNFVLPCKQFMVGGIAYDTPKATTEAEMIALKALLEPRKIKPKMTTSIVVRYNEFNGSSSFGCTLAKKRLAGSPPSLAKAQVIRLLVVMILVVANT